MSIKNIDWKNTAEEVIDGVIWYENPDVNVKVSHNGNVLSKLSGCVLNPTKVGKYSVKFSTANYSHPTTIESLMTHILGIKKNCQNSTIFLLDKNLGWVYGNIATDFKGHHTVVDVEYFNNKSFTSEVSTTVDNYKTLVDPYQNKEVKYTMFTEYKQESKFITEDEAEFPTMQLAQWHQETVSKAKSNAQVVLDYNGGYVLAEKVYLNEVVYNKKQPYINFCDVMNNNSGVVHEVGHSYCLFDKEDLVDFGVDGIKEYTLEEAKKIESIITSIKVLQSKLDGIV